MALIADINHDDVVVEVYVHILFGQAKECHTTFQIAHNAVAVGIALHEDSASAYKQIKLHAQFLFGHCSFCRTFNRVCHYINL